MKNIKRIMAIVLSLIMIAVIFTCVSLVPAMADTGDVFTVDAVPDNWKWYTSNYIIRASSGAQFQVKTNTNKGNGLDNYGVMISNTQSTQIIKPSTAYRIKFRLATWFTLDKLQVDIDTGTSLWQGRAKHVQTFSALAGYSSNSTGGGSSKLYTDITIDVVTDPSISGNQHFILGVIPKSGNAGGDSNIVFYNITITELGSYTVIDDETGENLGTVYGLVDDDVYELLENNGFSQAGYQMVADIDFIEEDTESIYVTYLLEISDVQTIDFGDSYAGGSPNWHYIPDAPAGHVSLVGGQIKHDTSTTKGDIGQHSVTLANSYGNSGLMAGGTYRLTFKLKTFPLYTPLESLSADIRFGTDIWTSVISGATISLTGEDLAAAVTSYSPSSSGSVTFTISLYVTLPESGWASATARNILLGIYGGEYWLDDVTISTTGQFKIVDADNNLLGKAYGSIGDSTAAMIPDSLVGSDYTFTTSPATIGSYQDRITLTKALKPNIAQLINFGSTDYPGNTETGTGNYYSKDSGAKLINQGTSIKGDKINVGNTFGFRSIVLANNRSNSGLEAGETYRIKVWFTSYYQPSAFGLQIKFGAGIWQTMNTGALTYTGSDLSDKITVLRQPTSNQSGSYLLTVDVTLPEASAWNGYTTNKNILLSLYGTGNTQVEYWLSKSYIYRESTATVTSYDELYEATVSGFEGDEISEAVTSDGSAKFVDISDKFGVENVDVSSGSVIYRGDSDKNFEINTDDLIVAGKYLLGTAADGEYDLFGLDAAADNSIDVRDYVCLKNTILGKHPKNYNLPSGLNYSNYELKWNCEFDGSAIDSNYFDTQWGMIKTGQETEGKYDDIDIVGTDKKKYSYVKNGMLVMSPDDNYGAGNTIAVDPYTTRSTMKFTYGYMEIRAKLPFSRANFPALWLKSETNNGSLYEIDVMETLGSSNSVNCNIHYWNNTTDYSADAVVGRSRNLSGETDSFHRYGFEWYKKNGVSYIAFYVDGVHVQTLSRNNLNAGNIDFNQEMYLILENIPVTESFYDYIHDWAQAAQVAEHGDYPMDVCIDYVRLFQSSSNTGNTLWQKS